MRGVSYDYTFMLPDKTYLSFTDQSMPELLANVKKLTKTHYELDFKISRDTVYNIIHRPDVAHKFYASKISIKNIIRIKKDVNYILSYIFLFFIIIVIYLSNYNFYTIKKLNFNLFNIILFII